MEELPRWLTMKPLREQFIDALGYKGKTLAHYRNFTLTVLAGFGVLFGEVSGMEFHSGGSAFDLKVAIGCFTLAVICVLLAANRLLVMCSAVAAPGALVFWNYVITGNRMAGAYYWGHVAAGFLLLILGVFAKLLWQRLRAHRTR